jgi:tight adherence protein B
MTVLVFIFIALLIITFTILIFASKPSKHQEAVRMRLGKMGLGDQVEGHEHESEVLLKEPSKGQFPWFDGLLSRFALYDRLQQLIEQADSRSTPAKTVLMSFGLAVGGFLAASLFVPVLAVQAIAGAVVAAVPVLYLRFQRARRLKAFNAALPDAMDLMARALRAGHAVGSAIEVVAQEGREPVASEFARVYQQQNYGLPFRESLVNIAQRIQSQDLQFVITAMLVQKETGGNLAEILDRTTYVIRERCRIQGEVRIKSAQGRLTGWILSLLPIFMGVLINIVNRGFEEPLFEDPIGRIMLYVGAGMLFVGAMVIRKIVKIEV